MTDKLAKHMSEFPDLDIKGFRRELMLLYFFQAKVELLSYALPIITSHDTSADPDAWSTDNPLKDHCAIISCLVQDWCGGDIIRGTAILPDGNKISHYWNAFDGRKIDFTQPQFPEGTTYEIRDLPDGFATVRDYILAPRNGGTVDRYEKLKQRFLELIKLPAIPENVFYTHRPKKLERS